MITYCEQFDPLKFPPGGPAPGKLRARMKRKAWTLVGTLNAVNARFFVSEQGQHFSMEAHRYRVPSGWEALAASLELGAKASLLLKAQFPTASPSVMHILFGPPSVVPEDPTAVYLYFGVAFEE